MTSTGIRELKDNVSRYIRRIKAGERIAIMAHGRVVAELGPRARLLRGPGPHGSKSWSRPRPAARSFELGSAGG